jgi:indolepyruvate ferredoxin oxidoreductase alpha subunit
MVEKGFELSEASNTPVMLELRIRACHVHGSFRTRANRRADYTLKDAIEHPRRDTSRIVLPPASYLHEQEKVTTRWPAATRFIREHGLNEFFSADAQDFGIVMQGGLYNGVLRALELLGLADAFGNSRVPLYVLNVTYPLVDEEVSAFCAGKRAVLLVEEGQPDFIEQALNTILRRADLQTRVHGKDLLPMAGEYTGGVLAAGIARLPPCSTPSCVPSAAFHCGPCMPSAPPLARLPCASTIARRASPGAISSCACPSSMRRPARSCCARFCRKRVARSPKPVGCGRARRPRTSR